ncbi:hypothetical protein M3Y95_00343600 [Aphelenchoides besseyi]|nr:hypothetical protein M3Y95_00343600 [Aphelenchoides besseyi]
MDVESAGHFCARISRTLPTLDQFREMDDTSSLDDFSADEEDFEFLPKRENHDERLLVAYRRFQTKIAECKNVKSELQRSQLRVSNKIDEFVTSLNVFDCPLDEENFALDSVIRSNLRVLERAHELQSNANEPESAAETRRSYAFLVKLMSERGSDVECPLKEEPKKIKFYNDEKIIEEFERIKEGLKIVNRVIETTTIPQIDLCRKQTVEKADNRHEILQALEHLSCWRQFLENRFAQFLILRYEKFPFCVESEQIQNARSNFYFMDVDFFQLFDFYRRHVVSLLQMTSDREVVWSKLTELIHDLSQTSIFAHFSSNSNLDVIDRRLRVVEMDLNAFRELIPTAHFLDPTAIGDSVERRETFRWFKFNLFVQHFRVYVDAWPLNAVDWSAIGEWSRWAQLQNLASNSIPEVDTKTVETVIQDAKTRIQMLCDFVDQIDFADEERREYVQLFKDMHIRVLD